jgi:AcrR family transcriptional regulator
VAAAQQLFLAKGYGATALAEVAQLAGVATKTVSLTFPTKLQLLNQVIGVALAGDDLPVPLRARDWHNEMMAAPPDRVLELFADNAAKLMERAALVLQMAEAAADSDPVVRRRRDQARQLRRADIRLVAEALASKVHRLDSAETTDVMYTLAAPQNYAQLVYECGWSRERYASWLNDTLRAILL